MKTRGFQVSTADFNKALSQKVSFLERETLRGSVGNVCWERAACLSFSRIVGFVQSLSLLHVYSQQNNISLLNEDFQEGNVQ